MTRAGRLLKYLAKRIARGTFHSCDAIALVGHSTGGLDIRWLLWELTEPRRRDIAVDGVKVSAAELFQLVRRVVFLSVPQWGTNSLTGSAPTGRANGGSRRTARQGGGVATARAGLRGGLHPPRRQFPHGPEPGSRVAGRPQRGRPTDRRRRPGAHRRRTRSWCPSSLCGCATWRPIFTPSTIWRRRRLPAIPDSPAHFPATRRAQEISRWGKRIRTQSYATLGRRPFRFDPGAAAPRWDLSNPWTYLRYNGRCPRSRHGYGLPTGLPCMRRRTIPAEHPGRRAAAEALEIPEAANPPLAKSAR